MRLLTRLTAALLGLAACTGAGLASAEAAVIYPVVDTPPFAPNTSAGAPTISVVQAGADITATWLPEPGQTVQIVVNGLSGATVALVCPDGSTTTSTCPDASLATSNPIAAPALRTSAYPGQCGNLDNPALATYAADFALSGNSLTSTDCGGMAVVRVTAPGAPVYTFVLPQDSNFNGIPDVWEATVCPAGSVGCLAAAEDIDTTPGNPSVGDGIANFDEYRGFIVSGAHARTWPTLKDLFIHLVKAQCGQAADSLIGAGVKTYITGDALLATVNTAGARLRLLGYTATGTDVTTNEWTDAFVSYSEATGFTFSGGPSASIPPAGDRQINRNAVYPGPFPQKGLRVIECLDLPSSFSTLGIASIGSPNDGDNAIIYTRRILSYFENALGACGTCTDLAYSTFQGGGWTAPVPISHDELIARAIAFYTGMEVGHSLELTPTQEGTNKVPTAYGYHHAPGTGSSLDQTIVNKVSNKTGNTFYIPTQYNTSDQTSYKLK